MKIENILKAVSDKNRIRIINYLIKGPQKVSNVSDKLDLEENLTSHHLRILANNKLLKSTKRGREVIYSINEAKFSSIIKDLLKNEFIKQIVIKIINEKKKSSTNRK